MRLLLGLILALLGPGAGATPDADGQRAFSSRGVTGTLLVRSRAAGDLLVHAPERVGERRPAASTFKIPNALVALEEGIVSGPEHPFPWDGVQRELPVWNGDQTLRSAFQVSCVWCFQRIAAEVGRERYRHWLGRFDYGVLADEFPLTEFWLDGSLRISAREQVAFLERLRGRTLPLSDATYDALAEVMRVETGPTHALYAKSGWFARTQPGTGWYVGWVDVRGDEDVVFFALAIDTRDAEDLPAREAIVREVLSSLGVLPAA